MEIITLRPPPYHSVNARWRAVQQFSVTFFTRFFFPSCSPCFSDTGSKPIIKPQPIPTPKISNWRGFFSSKKRRVTVGDSFLLTFNGQMMAWLAVLKLRMFNFIFFSQVEPDKWVWFCGFLQCRFMGGSEFYIFLAGGNCCFLDNEERFRLTDYSRSKNDSFNM